MRNLLLTIAYDGTNYCGWQYQPTQRTVQGAIEAVIERMTGRNWRLRGGSRTDAGVHAAGQIANVRLDCRFSCDELLHGMNALLPTDILIRDIREVPLEFESRRDNLGKLYCYQIWNSRERNLREHHRSIQLYRPFDLHLMAAAARMFVGEHDFASFRAADCDRETTVRTLYRCSLKKQGSMISIEIEGTAFLKNMVRILAGTLLDVGSGRITLSACANLLRSDDRHHAGPTLPAQGLTLVRVYPKT